MRIGTILALVLAIVFGVKADAPSGRTQPPVFGINLSMYGPHAPDQFVDDPVTHAMFAHLGVPLVRIPIRAGLTDQRLVTVLQAVKSAGATPVVILHGAVVADARRIDLHLLALVRGVFGTQRVYLELGNEEDNNGITAVRYTQVWNQVVTALRAHSPSAYQYGGPVAFDDDLPYINYFVRHASPRPAFISWHEYVCSTADSARVCTAHITRWGLHVARINALLRTAIGRTLPLMISEWNLDANPDPRYTQPAFIGAWVRRALFELERLRAVGVIGALYYTATSNQNSLVEANRRFTPEGASWCAVLAGRACG